MFEHWTETLLDWSATIAFLVAGLIFLSAGLSLVWELIDCQWESQINSLMRTTRTLRVIVLVLMIVGVYVSVYMVESFIRSWN